MRRPVRHVGRRVKRIEDAALLTGRARFVDDIEIADTLSAAFVRSPHAHAVIEKIDASSAAALAGERAAIDEVARLLGRGG